MRVELSADGWAELRDPATLTNGQRRPLMKASAELGVTQDEDGTANVDDVPAEKLLELGDVMLTAFISAWSFGPLPSEDPAALDNIPAHDYDRLQFAAGELMPQLVWNPEPGTDPT